MKSDLTSIPVTVLYYAQFREQRGIPRESVTTTAATALDLYRELCDMHSLMYEPDTVRVAINEELKSWSEPIRESDTMVFLAPFAGG